MFIRDWPEIGNTLSELSNIWRLGQVKDTKFGRNVSSKKLLHASKFQVYSQCRIWVINGKINMGVKIPPTHKTSHKFWDQSPSPSLSMSLAGIACCYSANILQHWLGLRGLIYFRKVDHSRISRYFSRNWVGLNNLCEILQIRLKIS